MTNSQTTVRVQTSKIETALRKAGGGIRALKGLVSLVIIDDRTIRRLNRRSLGRDRATDVLAYELGPGEGPWGEVVASAETASRQARKRGVPLWTELTLYLLHGTLHLAGYDDRDDDGFRGMHLAERKLLKRAGLADAVIRRLVPDSMVFVR